MPSAGRPRLALSLAAALFAAAVVPGLVSRASGQTVPEGWTVADLGQAPAQSPASAPALSEGSWTGEGAFTLNGAGSGIKGTADQFRFVYQRVSGNQDVVARVVALESSAPAARAGLMVRQDLTPGAAHAGVLVGPGTGPSSPAAGRHGAGPARPPVAQARRPSG